MSLEEDAMLMNVFIAKLHIRLSFISFFCVVEILDKRVKTLNSFRCFVQISRRKGHFGGDFLKRMVG